jgi:hypothetical protein
LSFLKLCGTQRVSLSGASFLRAGLEADGGPPAAAFLVQECISKFGAIIKKVKISILVGYNILKSLFLLILIREINPGFDRNVWFSFPG